MITVKEVSSKEFYNSITTIEYRDDDEREAKEYGNIDVVDTYRKSIHPFNKYFIFYEDDIAVCPIILARNGSLIFFIAKTINNKVGLIKALKKLANDTVECCGPILTKTASWYTEALRLNEVIGFKPYKLYDNFGYYVLGYKIGL